MEEIFSCFRWLYKLLSRIFLQAKTYVVNASRSPEEIKKLDNIVSRLATMKKDHAGKVMKHLRKMFNDVVDNIVKGLSEHLSTRDVKERFTSWSLDEAPANKGPWTEVERNVNTLLSSRFQEIVYRWEKKTQAFANALLLLMQMFQNHYDDVEFQLQVLQSDATDVEPGKRRFRFRISRIQKLEWTVKRIFYRLPSFTTRLIRGDLKCAFDQMRASDLTKRDTQALYKGLLSKVSIRILVAFTNNEELKPFVEEKLKDVKSYLDTIETLLPEMIQADMVLYKQRMKEETERSRYQPLLREVEQHLHQLTLLGLTEVCAVRIDHKKLDWKEETSSCNDHGAFGAVYQGTMRSDGEVTTVALKVWKEALDVNNAIKILEETKNLRYEEFFSVNWVS